MKCNKCGKKINFKQYFRESINPFKRAWHICNNCHEKYKVKTHFWHLAILFITVLKTYKYWLINAYCVYLNFREICILSLIAIGIIYFFCVLEQLLYFLLKFDRKN